MLKLIKGESVKILDPQSTLIPVLKEQGWKVEGEKDEDNALAELRAEAEKLGLKVHHKAGAEKIRELIEEAKK